MSIEEKIGEKIRELRKSKRMTIAQLSRIANISEGQLSRIENGKSSTPISTLEIISRALGTKIGYLFDENEPEEAPGIVVTKKDQRIRVRKGMMEFGYNYEALAAKRRNRLMDPFILRIDREKGDESIIFNHPGEELIFILKGEILFTYEDQRFYLEKGDCVYFDASGSHSVKNIGKTDVEFISIVCSNELRMT